MNSCYLNNAFAKQPHPEVVEAMLPYLRQRFENPLTGSESAESIRSAIESSRTEVALLLVSERFWFPNEKREWEEIREPSNRSKFLPKGFLSLEPEKN